MLLTRFSQTRRQRYRNANAEALKSPEESGFLLPLLKCGSRAPDNTSRQKRPHPRRRATGAPPPACIVPYRKPAILTRPRTPAPSGAHQVQKLPTHARAFLSLDGVLLSL